jgi:putative endonuclease
MKSPVGKAGEDHASKYLQKHGYKILERNFRTRNGEIDIVAIDTLEKEPILCFVEVKTRTSDAFGLPIEAIGYYKLKFLIRAGEFYKATHKNLPDGLRIDAVSIHLLKNDTIGDIELIKNISG